MITARIVHETPNTLTALCTCPSCRKVSKVTIKSSEWYAYQNGSELIQDAMPSLSADDRELLMSGTCPACWQKMEDDAEQYMLDVEYGDGPESPF